MLFITQDIDKSGMSYVMLNIALFDTLGRHFGFLFDIGDVKGIHFCPQTHKFFGRDRVGFIFKFTNDLCVDGTVQGMCFRTRTGVVVMEIFRHVLIQIVGLNLIAEAVCVSKQQPRPICAILILDMIAVEVVH